MAALLRFQHHGEGGIPRNLDAFDVIHLKRNFERAGLSHNVCSGL